MRDCVGTALVFSGRPDPEWRVPALAVRQLRTVWSTLAAGAAALPAVPPLGYRGVVMRCRSGDAWHASHGVVAHTPSSGAAEYRADPERTFERLLLSTAPAGVLPPQLV